MKLGARSTMSSSSRDRTRGSPSCELAKQSGRTAAGALIGIEHPFDRIFDEAVVEHRAGMIEDDAVGLAIGGPENAADHLAVKTHLFGRPRQDAAAGIGHVP